MDKFQFPPLSKQWLRFCFTTMKPNIISRLNLKLKLAS